MKGFIQVILAALFMIVPLNQVANAEETNCDVDKWLEESIYTEGDHVSFDGEIYEAKWWTQGEKPSDSGEWDVWTLAPECSNDGKESLSVWAEKDTYEVGDRVQHEGAIYEAKWWTQGENPESSGEWDVWEKVDQHDLRVMSFNIWTGGIDETVHAIEEADADIVGVQEEGGLLDQLADELGYYADYNQEIISRYPIIDVGHPDYVYVEVEPDEVVAVSNVHLLHDPYGPYDIRDGFTVDQVIGNERHHMMEMRSRFDSLTALQNEGVPVFLTGDFNVPSHHDWTEETKEENFNTVVEWPVSKQLETLGFRDSYREIHESPLEFPSYTWTPGYPPGNVNEDEVHDRIDFVYATGSSITTNSEVVGEVGPYSDIELDNWPSDHRSVVSTFTSTLVSAPEEEVATSQMEYEIGETIEVNFYVDDQPSEKDQVAIYPKGSDREEDPMLWAYTGSNSQEPGEVKNEGTIFFDEESVVSSEWPLPAGEYEAVFLAAGDEERATTSFKVLESSESASLNVEPKQKYGEPIKVEWEDATGFPYDWVGIYPIDESPDDTNSLQWQYLGGERQGSLFLDGSWGNTDVLEPGEYRIYMFENDGYSILASTEVTVVAE
ncbi:endonuclease/exonuclease/phosphatase family protein [Virgibacillus sp. NKC19-3]|uniref:carbohydrate-binding protein n=1 Tax=Virgibacillus saliphilus TaxID=2831674 RepID=UPI001C9BADA6|nr:endonuclease/exonuclease/phosphatase family protein [Virgibacillus sp. NKC19-3]MBY7144342.1 endonuclease/exonuclease/phosphatase family protein [Virgibacillus sp. NKC19-3]